MTPVRCSHVREDGSQCKGWANRSGCCPNHDGRTPYSLYGTVPTGRWPSDVKPEHVGRRRLRARNHGEVIQVEGSNG